NIRTQSPASVIQGLSPHLRKKMFTACPQDLERPGEPCHLSEVTCLAVRRTYIGAGGPHPEACPVFGGAFYQTHSFALPRTCPVPGAGDRAAGFQRAGRIKAYW